MTSSRVSWLITGSISLALCTSLVLTVQSNDRLRETIKHNKQELKVAQDELDRLTVSHGEVQTELFQAKDDFFEKIVGFKPATIDQDDELVLDYLDKIFTWDNGSQYDEQRDAVETLNAKGTDRLLKEVMTENYRVPVPENLKGQIKDNDIDIHGLRSKLVSSRLNRLSWGKSSSADVTYTARAAYQVYVDERDLKGDYKTVREMLFTVELSGTGSDRKVVDVKYTFVQ